MKQYTPRTEERRAMWNAAGYRERYAMEHGNERHVNENGRDLIVFTYSKYDEYQDANGAAWDRARRAWVY